MNKDNINPNHYKGKSMEVINVLEEFTEGVSGVKAVCMGNVIKYILRWHKKNGLEDLYKARWYLDRLIGYIRKEEDNND